MAAPLSTCTVEEQRNVIGFLWSDGVKPSEIYRRIKVQYGHGCLSQGRVYEWVETDDKMSVMNTGLGDQLAWQVRQ